MAGKRTHIEGTTSLDKFLVACEVIPPLADLRRVVAKNLVLSNPQYAREPVINRVTNMIYRWLHEYGSTRTAELARTVLQGCQFTVVTPKERSNGERISVDGQIEIVDAAGDRQDDVDHHDLVGGARDVEYQGPKQDAEERCVKGRGAATKGAEVLGGAEDVLPATGGEAVSRRLVVLELSEHESDLTVFQTAYNLIHRRVAEVRDEGRLMKLVTWSGTSAVMGSLELTIHMIERTVGELRDILRRIDCGEIQNADE